jgi:dihydroxyacetone kinase
VTHLFNTAESFKDDFLAGFVNSYARYVELVPGTSAVMRAGGPRADKVSVVGGGGSGHYPAFCGIVGEGLLDAAVVGSVFASPSAEQVYRTGRALDGGAGVLLAAGNYAGDVLNFRQAQQRLLNGGVDCRSLFITDDVASAEPDNIDQRRGIAGDFVVYKMAGAVADRGAGLDEVERVALKANAVTRSMGVAFDGCTLPGSPEKLFSVKAGHMDVGLGIHGEPGIRTVPWMPARELADLLVEPLLAERPVTADGRIAVLVNGLGATKYEELFVLWGSIAAVVERAGLQVVLPEVGELVTSLDMAGCSLTFSWLDDELADLWSAPCETPGFRRGPLDRPGRARAVHVVPRSESSERPAQEAPDTPLPDGWSRRAAACFRQALNLMLDTVREHQVELGRLDSVAGDGDHGNGMVRGLAAAVAKVNSQADRGLPATLAAAGNAWSDEAGGTSGMLWGVLLGEVGAGLDGHDQPTGSDIVAAMRRGAEQIQTVGGARLGDKTMLDVLIPFLDGLDRELVAHDSFAEAWVVAAAGSTTAADLTAALVPKIGRARPLAERSIGSPDPGAVSMSLCLIAAGEAIFDHYRPPR